MSSSNFSRSSILQNFYLIIYHMHLHTMKTKFLKMIQDKEDKLYVYL